MDKVTASEKIAAEVAVMLKVQLKSLPARLVRMRLGPTCGRCGGSGSYSYCQQYGTTCFGCSGYGQRVPKTAGEWKATAERAAAAVQRGELAAYLATRRGEALVSKGTKQVLAAWSATTAGRDYGAGWREAATLPATPYNSRMAAAHEAVSKAQRCIGKPTAEGYAEAVAAFVVAVQAALAEIAAAEADYITSKGGAQS